MKSARSAVERLGVVDAALMAVDRALAWISRGRARLHKYYFMAQPVPAAAPVRMRAAGIAVEELAAGDPRLALLARPGDELQRRFAAAARCFGAWHGDTLAGFLWFTAGAYEEDEVRCTFRVEPRDEAVWDFDVHVEPAFRLGRTFALLWEAAFGAMRARGVRWTLSRVSAFKAESMRAHQRLGARRTGWAIFLSFGSLQITLTSRGRLKCRSLEHRPYPALTVRAPSDARAAPDGALAEPVAAGRARRPT